MQLFFFAAKCKKNDYKDIGVSNKPYKKNTKVNVSGRQTTGH